VCSRRHPIRALCVCTAQVIAAKTRAAHPRRLSIMLIRATEINRIMFATVQVQSSECCFWSVTERQLYFLGLIGTRELMRTLHMRLHCGYARKTNPPLMKAKFNQAYGIILIFGARTRGSRASAHFSIIVR
jgi:hypothetical protein